MMKPGDDMEYQLRRLRLLDTDDLELEFIARDEYTTKEVVNGETISGHALEMMIREGIFLEIQGY
eukprot:2835940-Heterocapsa_arctica.AAC.1